MGRAFAVQILVGAKKLHIKVLAETQEAAKESVLNNLKLLSHATYKREEVTQNA